MKGRIEVITGSMFSGKTTEWARRLEREQIAKKKVGFFKPEIEDRYGKDIISDRNKTKIFKANLIPINGTEKDIEDFVKFVSDYQVIGIDEVQFFGPWIVELCRALKNEGKRVIVNGLDMTYEGEPFGYIGALMAISYSVDKLHAVCMCCGEDAVYSQRLLNGKPAPAGDLVKLGDGNIDENKISYEARCEKCFVPPHKVIL